MNLKYWIEKLQLEPHPEGGYFKETYRSEGTIAKSVLPEEFSGARNYSTGIFFLLDGDNFSAFHRLHQDEMWHFYDGGTLLIHAIDPQGRYQVIKLGRSIEKGETLQAVIPGGYYFASEVADKSEYALVGCTVSPGFDFNDFEMPDRKSLASQFPGHTPIIHRLTRG